MFKETGNNTKLNSLTNFPETYDNPTSNSTVFANGIMYLVAINPAKTVAMSPVGAGCSPIGKKYVMEAKSKNNPKRIRIRIAVILIII